ncbi:hypothetical protein RGJ01_001184 [Serratia marcescens]
MSKKITVYLPQGEIQEIYVPEDATSVTMKGDKGAFLDLPIESIDDADGKKHSYARYSDLISKDEVIAGLK